MTSSQTDEVTEVQRPEQMQMMFDEIRNLQMQLNQLKEDMEILMEEQEKTQKLIQGGSQPKEQIQIVSDKGGPGCLPVAKIMKEARSDAKHKGITSSEAETLLKEEGYDRSRQSVLNILDRIASEFPNYEVRKGGSSKPTALYFSK